MEYIDKDAAEFTTFAKQMLFDETSDQVVRIGKSLVPVAQLWLRDPDHARFKNGCANPSNMMVPPITCGAALPSRRKMATRLCSSYMSATCSVAGTKASRTG